MGWYLPGEPHAAVDLDAGPSIGDSGLVGQELGPSRGHGGIAHVGLVHGDGRGLYRAPGHLGPHRHVGTEVLDGLEPADGASELDPSLGVLHSQITGPLSHADLQGGGEHSAIAPPPCRHLGASH